jgi:hypothetical protein
MWVVFWTLIPAVALVLWIGRAFHLGDLGDSSALAVGVAYMAAWAIALIRLGLSHCPRCGQFFFVKRHLGARNPWSRRCLNCGLDLYA